MSEKPDTGHLERWRLSELLDEPEGDPRAAAHLESCPECRREFERLSRIRMALSALGELDPPAGQWERIEARLRTRVPREATGARSGVATEGGPRPTPRGTPGGWRLPAPWTRWTAQLAAAIVLFAGGVAAGLYVTAERDGGSVAAGEEEYEDHLEALGELAELGAPRVEAGEGPLDPVAVAERLARLEALIRASSEALERSPGDPVANGLLFQLVEERDFLADRLNRSLRLVALEYR